MGWDWNFYWWDRQSEIGKVKRGEWGSKPPLFCFVLFFGLDLHFFTFFGKNADE